MFKLIKGAVKNLLNRYPKWICRREFEAQTFKRFNERPVELAFVFRILGLTYPRTILDVGTGITSLPHLLWNCGFIVTAIDNVRDYWPSGMMNRHFHVIDDDITRTRLVGKYDFITCVSVLEHIEDADSAVSNMFSLLNDGGSLILTFPYCENDYVRNVYELPGSSYGAQAKYITQSFSRAHLNRWMEANGGTVVSQEYWRFWDGAHWTVGNQVIPPERVGAEELHQLSCVHIRKG